MEDKKLNYKLLNIVLVLAICFLFYSTLGLWKFIFDKMIAIVAPFLISFVVAYALYPFLKKLEYKGVRKGLAMLLILTCIVGFFIILMSLLVPIIIRQAGSFSSSLSNFISEISSKYNIDLQFIQTNVMDINSLISNYGKSTFDLSISFLSKSMNIMSKGIICFICSIYFLSDMENIRSRVKKILKRKHKRTFNYLKRIDYEVSQYFVGLEKYIIIQFFEYTIVFFLIGHPYYLLLGILCSITTIIPYFGGIFANIVACITAFFVSPKLFILTLIVALICPNIDGYIISPRVYGKTNNVPALVTIFAVFAGGIIYGVFGIIIALPVAIILMATYKFYEDDISDKIEEIANQK
jgi:predicted PurR-regulated permease PerM